MEIERKLITYRKDSPCHNCTERFTACHDKCPKDMRGEEGYKAWTEHNQMIREERKKYDKLHSGKFKY